jgi:glycosyltransferase involved in cell wall biosynthesis
MALNIDLTDVALHAIQHDDFSGVHRVQIELAGALKRLHGGSANAYSSFLGLYHDLDFLFAEEPPKTTSDIYADIHRFYSLRHDLPFRALLRLKLARQGVPTSRRASKPRLGAEDVLFIGGAFWAHPHWIRTYERAARAGCDVVVLYHDLIPVTFPELTRGRSRPFFERMLRLPTRAIAISEHTKAQLEEARRAVGAPPRLDPATVVPLAHEFSAAPRNHAAPEPPSLRTAMLDRMGAFALCVGTVEIRKNHVRLLKLWESLAREAGGAWPKLVVAGKEGWKAQEAVRALRRASAEAPYLWIEAPTDKELVWLYGRAGFTVFPSLVEGWGLPIGESLWFGKPCVASNAASMPEVGGALCSYGDPHDIDTFAEPIMRLVRDAGFHQNAVAAIKASPLRTWAEAANEIAAAVSLSPRGASGRSAHGRDAAPENGRVPAPA